MVEIEELSNFIEEELHDAKKYAKCALKNKASNKSKADVFYKLANEEMNHMALLHNEVVKLIEQYRKEHGDPPPDMLARYNYIHGKHIEKATKVKMLLQMYQT